jgi:hypothetical protein
VRPAGFQLAAFTARNRHINEVKLRGTHRLKSLCSAAGAKQSAAVSWRFDRFSRDRFATDPRNQNCPAAPNAARPGEFAGQNSEAKWDDDNCGSRQNNHHQPDQYNAEANRADEKSAQARPRFEPETRNPFLKPTIHKKGLSVKAPTTFDCALSRDETR